MDFSKLTSTERMAAIAAVVIVVTALISIANSWGTLMFVPLIAGIAALAVIFGPQIMPGTKMPGTNGSLLVTLGVVSVLVWIVVLIDNGEWVAEHIINLDTFQFVIGLAAAAYLAWAGWQTLQGEGGNLRFGTDTAAAAPPPASPPASPPPAAAPPSDPAATGDPATTESREQGGAP